MKCLLLMALLTLTATSYAATRDIYDLMYLPSAGTSFGTTDALYISSSSDTTDVSGFVFNQSLGHSVTENLSLAVTLNYANMDIEPDTGSNSKISGVSDPSFIGRYRLMDEALRWDFLAGTTLGPGINETDSDGDQNNYTGRVIANLGTQFGQKKEKFQWAVTALYTRNFKTTHKDDGVTSAEDAFNAYSVEASILHQLAEVSFVKVSLGLSLSESHKRDDDVKYLQSTMDYVQAEYQHLFSKDFLFRVGAMFAATNYSSSNDQSDSSDVHVGAIYQF
jgi:hypothetical protein